MRKPGFQKYILSAACMFSVCNAYSFTWQDLWVSPDKQAEALMKEGKFAKAGELFQQAPWKAAASYRAKNYKQAAQQFGVLQSESGYYNQGNALAKTGQYKDALKAYDKALAINPSNQDAIYNRKLVEELLKKNQDKQQDKQSDQKQQDDKNKQNQQDKKNQQNKSGNQDNQQNDNNQGKPEDKEQQDNKQESGKDNKEESGKDSKEQQAKEQQDKDSKTGEKPTPAKNEKTNNTGKEQATAPQTAEEREKQQAKEQWLKLIPDDPGGLMREKFMRDYIRRQRGWQQ